MASRTRIANETWEALFRAQATIAGELQAGDAWGDLRPHDYGVLYALSTALPAGLRITELRDDVLLTQPGLSRLIARLEDAGLVEREADPDDGRASRIRLTEAFRANGITAAGAGRPELWIHDGDRADDGSEADPPPPVPVPVPVAIVADETARAAEPHREPAKGDPGEG